MISPPMPRRHAADARLWRFEMIYMIVWFIAVMGVVYSVTDDKLLLGLLFWCVGMTALVLAFRYA